jgi:putative ABC transport system permease protein
MVRLDSYKGKALDGSSMSSFHSESPAIKELYPQVENYVRLHQANGMMSYHNDNGEALSYFESNGFYTDSSFFSIFSFPLVLGNRNTVLKNTNSMLMSESAAKKYFGNTDPLGKIINLTTEWEGGNYVVEGVFKDIPQNSHVRFDFLFAIEKLLNNQQFKKGGWYWENFQNYLLLKPGTDVKELEAGFSRIIDTHLRKELIKANSSKKLILFPLDEIHLYCPIAYVSNGNYQLVYFILTIAFLVICIAWLNYLNLSTARAIQRAKEIGIRKVMGSERAQLVKQFLFESFLVSFIAIVITALLLVTLKSYFNDLVGKELVTDVTGQISFWLITAFFLSAGIFITGFYPAWILSSFRPINALKGGFVGIQSGERTRKAMVILQFTASILLIASTLTIREQIIFMRSQDMGINVKQKLVVRAPRIIGGDSRLNKISAFKNLLMQHPTVKNVASSSEVPGKPIFWAKEFKLVQQSDDDKRVLHVLSVDEDFVTTYGLSLVAGRNFSEQHPSDFGGSVLINETALNVLGIKDPESALDQEIEEFVPQRIIGVVKDFQQESMKKSFTPIVFVFIPWDNDFFTISLESPNIRADVNLIVEAYKKTFPDNAIDYYFLDDFLDQQYKSEEQFWNIFKVFSMLAIFISCMGLFGLSSLVISKRTKEVGIRKVLGSSVAGIIGLLSVDFLKLIIIAFILAIPLTMLVMNEWLEGFARRINIPWWIYIVSGAIAIIVAIVTISSQAIRAAIANPVKSLRSE